MSEKDCKFSKSEMRHTYQIVTNLSCNLDCSYCYERKNKWVNNIKDIRIFLDTMYKRDVGSDNGRIIELIGGESLLHIDLFEEILNYARFLTRRYRTCTFYSSCTNGTLFKIKSVRDFLERNKDLRMGISIDGTKEVHDRYRVYPNGKGSYDDIIEWWDWFKERAHSINDAVRIKATFTKDSFRDSFVESMKHLFSLAPDSLSGNVVYEDKILKEDSFWVYDRFIQVIDYIIDNKLYKETELSKFFDSIQSPELLYFNKRIPENNYCGSGKWMTALGREGKIFGCMRFTTMNKPNMEIGEIIDGKVIMQSPSKLLNDIKEQYKYWPSECINCHLKGSCASCVAAPYESDSIKEKLAEKPQCGWTFAFAMAKLYSSNRMKEIGEYENIIL